MVVTDAAGSRRASVTDSGPVASAEATERSRTLTARGATVLGIGSMIGAGIFALLGEAGAVAGAAVWISFLIGGVVAFLLGYVCARLGMTYPLSGGLITYLIKGFGLGRLVGIASWLGYIAAIVIVPAMVAVSFGDHAVHRRERELRLEPPVHHAAPGRDAHPQPGRDEDGRSDAVGDRVRRPR